MTTGTNSFVSFRGKIILELASSLSAPAADKIHKFAHLSFHLILHLIDGTSADLQKFLRYLLMAWQLLCFLRFHLLHLKLFAYNLVLQLKGLKALPSIIPALKLLVLSLE